MSEEHSDLKKKTAGNEWINEKIDGIEELKTKYILFRTTMKRMMSHSVLNLLILFNLCLISCFSTLHKFTRVIFIFSFSEKAKHCLLLQDHNVLIGFLFGCFFFFFGSFVVNIFLTRHFPVD